jgi:hypothetical protein
MDTAEHHQNRHCCENLKFHNSGKVGRENFVINKSLNVVDSHWLNVLSGYRPKNKSNMSLNYFWHYILQCGYCSLGVKNNTWYSRCPKHALSLKCFYLLWLYHILFSVHMKIIWPEAMLLMVTYEHRHWPWFAHLSFWWPKENYLKRSRN